MASPVYVCRAVCEGSLLLRGPILSNTRLLPPVVQYHHFPLHLRTVKCQSEEPWPDFGTRKVLCRSLASISVPKLRIQLQPGYQPSAHKIDTIYTLCDNNRYLTYLVS